MFPSFSSFSIIELLGKLLFSSNNLRTYRVNLIIVENDTRVKNMEDICINVFRYIIKVNVTH
jgi:hypothetical protein